MNIAMCDVYACYVLTLSHLYLHMAIEFVSLYETCLHIMYSICGLYVDMFCATKLNYSMLYVYGLMAK